MKLDSNGEPAPFEPGTRVYVIPLKMWATVVEQTLHHDCGETFWGNLALLYDDGIMGTSHCWQVKRSK